MKAHKTELDDLRLSAPWLRRHALLVYFKQLKKNTTAGEPGRLAASTSWVSPS